MPRLFPLAALPPLLATLALAGQPMPKDPPPKTKTLTPEQQAKLKERDELVKQRNELAKARKVDEVIAAVGKIVGVEEAVFGKVSQEVADTQKGLAGYLKQVARWDEARAACGRWEQLAVKLHGKDSWQVTDARLAKEDVAVLEKLLPEDRSALLKVTAVNDNAVQLFGQGRHGEAEPLLKDALAGYRKALGDAHPRTLTGLNNLATVYRLQQRYSDAEPLFEEALAGRRKVLGNAHPDTLMSASNLALAYKAHGRDADAEPLFEEALTGRRKVLGHLHRSTLNSLENLAWLYTDQHRHAAAEPLYKEALAGRRQTLGDTHPDTLTSASKLGLSYLSQGRYSDAEPLFKEALAGARKSLGSAHPDTLNSLNSLATLYSHQDRHADAEPLYKEALAGRRKALGNTHPDTLTSLSQLAASHLSQGRYPDAERLLLEALAGQRKALGGAHPDTLNSLSTLGALRCAQAQYADAQLMFAEALAGRRKALGDRHPITLIAANNLALVHKARGRDADAGPLFKESLTGTRTLLALSRIGQTEGQQLASRASHRYQLDSFLLARTPTADRYAEALAWKGAAFARQSQLRGAIAGSGDDALKKLFAESSDVARQLANLTNVTPPTDQLAAYRKALKELSDRKDDIDQELTRKSEPFRKAKETAALTPDQLAKALPADVAVVDFLEYSHVTPDPDNKGRWMSEQRFLAFVVRNGKPVVEVELKASAPVAEAVAAWRQAIERGGGNGEAANNLRKLVWEPVAKHLGDAKTVLISPDGALGRVPFAALPGADSKKYLIEEVAVAVVPVPQLIPEMLSAKPNPAKPSLLVVGGVDFDAVAGTPSVGTDSRNAVRGGSAGKWGALAGTTAEAKAVSAAFAEKFPDGKTTSLTGTGATEAGVREAITGRRVLHFATHGFFAPPPPEPKEPVGLRMEAFDRNRAVGVHPGLQCGLVLAGANKPPKAGADDGILTALEVAGLDLRGVELAVLSACETGLGKESGGEGVLGLQRAFQAAGARAVVSSLWKVPDQSTAALMGRFYQHLWADKQPAAEALRRAQLELLRNPDKVAGWAKEFRRGATADDDGKVEATDGRLPPRAWAAFTLSGDWR